MPFTHNPPHRPQTSTIRQTLQYYLQRCLAGYLQYLAILAAALSFSSCNVTAPNVDFYRSTVPEQSFSYTYTDVDFSDASSKLTNDEVTPSNSTSTNLLFFYEHRDAISYLTEAVSTNDLKVYDLRLLLNINLDSNISLTDLESGYTEANLSGNADIELAAVTLGNDILSNDFSGSLEIIPKDTNWELTLTISHDSGQLQDYELKATFIPYTAP